jgi:tetratricopeptide (TPR) repeat protein
VRALALALTLPLVLAAAACGTGKGESARPPDTAGRETVRRFWSLYHEATLARSRSEFAAAALAYEEALAIDPRHEDCLYYLGRSREETGDRAAARAAYARLTSVNPTSARGHLALGALLASPDDSAPLELELAETHLRRAHEINGEETGPMLRLGELLIVRARNDEARSWLEAAMHSNPKSIEAAFLAGYLRWEAGDAEGARSLHARAQAAGRHEAPTRGVLSEGDRRASPPPAAAGAGSSEPARVAAPPLKEPMGKTLFGAFAEPLRAGAEAKPLEDDAALDRCYEPVRARVRRYAARAAMAPGTSRR